MKEKKRQIAQEIINDKNDQVSKKSKKILKDIVIIPEKQKITMFFNKKNMDQPLIPEKQRELPKIELTKINLKKEDSNNKIKKNNQSR